MFVFIVGSKYPNRVPLTLIELDRFTRTHTHRTPWHTTWNEDMELSVCVPGIRPAHLIVANDNQKAA